MAKENYPDGRDQIEKLKKLLMLTTSEHDAEALSAIRAANKIMATLNLTWDRCIGIPLDRMDGVSQGIFAQEVARQADQGFGMDSHARSAFEIFFAGPNDEATEPIDSFGLQGAGEIRKNLRRKAHGQD